MEGSGGGSSGRYDDEAPRRGALSPIRAGLVVLAMLLIAGAIFFLTSRSDSDPPAPIAQQTIPTIEPSVTEPLTESEAIAIFEELDELRLEMYRTRDLTLIPQVLASSSPLRPVARRELKQLRRRRVLVRTRNETKSLEVLQMTDQSTRIRQVVLQYPKFIDEEGKDVTSSQARPVRKVIVWTLREGDNGMLIFDSKTVRLRRIGAPS